MSELGETFKDWKAYNRAIRQTFGIYCPQCKIQRPKTNPSTLLPGQKCKVDGYRDPRQRLTETQIKEACLRYNAPYFERT